MLNKIMVASVIGGTLLVKTVHDKIFTRNVFRDSVKDLKTEDIDTAVKHSASYQ